MFLFVCLALLVIIGFTYDSRVRDSYWQQQRSHLTRVSSGMESQLQLMSDYSLQLRTDTTLLRLSNMHDETDANYVLAAYQPYPDVKRVRSSGVVLPPHTLFPRQRVRKLACGNGKCGRQTDVC